MGDRVHLRLCLLERDARLQAGHRRHPSALGLAIVLGRVKPQGQPQINGAAMKIKIRGKNTDDREWPGIDLNFPAQYALIAPKPVLPEAITDDNNPSIGGVFLLRE